MELLIPRLNKIISYQFLLTLLEMANHEQSSQHNQCLHGASPLKYDRILAKKSFSWEDKLGQKFMVRLF